MVKRQKNFKLKQAKGFTLIELMLATSLLMMVMFSGYYAYSLYSQKWQKRVQVFWKNTEQAVALDTINKVTNAAVPYVVNGERNQASIYFKGTAHSLSFVSSSALFSNTPALVEFELEAIEGSDTYQLIYKEHDFSEQLLLNVKHKPEWQHKVILLTGIKELNFSYFGWQTFQQATKQSSSNAFIKEDLRVWYSEHKTHVSRLLPEKIKIDFINSHGHTDFNIALSQHTLSRLMAYIRVDA